MSTCPSCAELNDADTVNCASCDTRLVPYARTTSSCAHHWFKLRDGTRVDRCIHCGGVPARRRTAAQFERERARKAAYRVELAARAANGAPPREILFVDGHLMAFYVRRFVVEFENAHGKQRKGDEHESRANLVLSARCREAGGNVSPKLIRTIANGHKRWLRFYETADPLLVALGLQHLEHSEFVPVPRAETAAVSTTSKATVSDQKEDSYARAA